jgi:hypothetical protein
MGPVEKRTAVGAGKGSRSVTGICENPFARTNVGTGLQPGVRGDHRRKYSRAQMGRVPKRPSLGLATHPPSRTISAPRLDPSYVFWPVLLEPGVVDLQILHHIGVVELYVVA